MSNERGTHHVVGEPGEAKKAPQVKITAIELYTEYGVISFSLTHMGSLSIVLSRENEFISIKPMISDHSVLEKNG